MLNSEITTAWENALAAAQKYGSYVAALGQIDSDINSANGTTHNDLLPENKPAQIVKQMYANSRAWFGASEEERKDLNQENVRLAALLAQYGINVVRGQDGAWYIDRVGGESLFEKYKKFLYHDGGIAGDKPTLKQNEVLAILEKGEAVLSKQKEQGLFRIVDFVTRLSEKLGTSLKSGAQWSPMAGGVPNVGRESLSPIQPGGNRVQFGNVYIYGANGETVAKHEEINRKFTNEVLKYLNIRR